MRHTRRVIIKPVIDMMKKLGFLDVVDGSAFREIGVCSPLKSLAVVIAKPFVQGMHADMSPYFDWGNDFGIFSITAGSARDELPVYPASFDGGMGSGRRRSSG